MKAYSFEDVSCAKVIRDNPHLFNWEFHKWANTVNCWFNNLLRLIRLYNKVLKNWQLSVKCVWDEIKTSPKHSLNAIIKTYLRSLHKDNCRGFLPEPTNYCKTDYPDKTQQSTKAYKSRLRMRYRNITERLQTI